MTSRTQNLLGTPSGTIVSYLADDRLEWTHADIDVVKLTDKTSGSAILAGFDGRTVLRQRVDGVVLAQKPLIATGLLPIFQAHNLHRDCCGPSPARHGVEHRLVVLLLFYRPVEGCGEGGMILSCARCIVDTQSRRVEGHQYILALIVY